MIVETTKFSATTIHLEHITTALDCLMPFGDNDALIYVDKDGLSFVRECTSVIRIQLYLSKELFVTYLYDEDEDEDGEGDGDDYMKLKVHLSHILNSFNVVNRNNDDIIECTMSYNGDGHPFVLIFEDSFISEKVEYNTYSTENTDGAALELNRQRITFECILKGDILYTVLKDLKEIGTEEYYIYVKTSKDYNKNIFAIISKSSMGYSKFKFPVNRSIIEKLQVFDSDSTTILYDEPIIGVFNKSSFDKIRMSTKIASKVLLRMDDNGLLSVNILSQTEDFVLDENTRTKNSNNDNNNNNNNNFNKGPNAQLPKDYPGIVIEISMLGSALFDDDVHTNICSLMDEDTINSDRSTSRVIDQGSGGNDDTHDENIPSTNDIPLFF
ncbi:hypothetical protein Kpol_1049p12 [Vanderwaltozyma polyspora DSM 70294]|uniref:DNA damage checkpoint control protein RAD17 n=1 Tax=Vanderwaltozyma polyspora (strain ATCC 22028 / DSM 70294 / BCRC 21397 / CBS 2163 / NBRC 10782 / NRRL Y-8283 / UCD 57-17) TaxID=436907 RepID=A7TPQ2_VANPO|nr:uncharacterized protein Kpol_1049p12 [Vanderwaltozyma polyspora DSM 70294]EDO15754.1 hypothetical protein Kpol_1049p12 [Vanderwaltozyma polyspora DSM 70294]